MKKLFIPIILCIGLSLHNSAQEIATVDSNGKSVPGKAIDDSNVKSKGDKESPNYSFRKEKDLSLEESRGNKYAFSYSYVKAIDCYTHVKKLSIDGQRKLAESYHNIDQNIKSEEEYLKLINYPVEVLPLDYYNYAMVLKINGKYAEARKWLNVFNEMAPKDLRAKSYMASKYQLTDLQKNDKDYTVEHMNINTDADDFGSCFYKDKIVFASTRSNAKFFKRKDNWNGKPYFNIYVAEIEKGQMKNPEVFTKSLDGNMHDGPASFSNDGTFMAFTRNNYDDKSKDRVVELQIYFSSLKEEKWSKPEPFIMNKPNYSVGHPSLTADEKTMYFTSDMPGGFGGTDIYRITKDASGMWSNAENLGDLINTEGDEMFPFIEETSRTLYFSSNGLYGLGGFDIFTCPVIGTGFGEVVNLGTPVNSQYDDFSAIINYKQSKGYFSSDRSGGSGGVDIYSFEYFHKMDTVITNVQFAVFAPKNIPSKRRVRETFPIRNYVFFNPNSDQIPDRYVLLRKDQVKEFKEDQLEVFTPKQLSGRSNRQMTAYYNVLNILGDRMGKNPTTVVRLTGASMEGENDGIAMAKSVKQYLVDVFDIKENRISTEGRIKPRIPSENPGVTNQLEMLRECDRRVSIWSESSELLMEFQSGPDAPLKPVTINIIQEAPLDSYVSFKVDGGKDTVDTWTMKIEDDAGKSQNFGPFTSNRISLPGKKFLGTRPQGDFKISMTSISKKGIMLKKDTVAHMVLWMPSEREEGQRYSIIYEYNNSDAIKIYERYLTDIVIPKIPKNAKLILSGHADITGPTTHNMELSLARANDAKEIFEKGLSNAGRNDVAIDVYGFGEDIESAPFGNKYPEERFYNRTVIIDVIPQDLEFVKK